VQVHGRGADRPTAAARRNLLTVERRTEASEKERKGAILPPRVSCRPISVACLHLHPPPEHLSPLSSLVLLAFSRPSRPLTPPLFWLLVVVVHLRSWPIVQSILPGNRTRTRSRTRRHHHPPPLLTTHHLPPPPSTIHPHPRTTPSRSQPLRTRICTYSTYRSRWCDIINPLF
jgi:hypothetical protein